ncbi:hypothetical protein ACFVIM_16970 [Streptomyces sp. NPDC057638]|uniref:hypothetical protein n=1 Tax=Streptomyces sp. NPDC057638 TaxID=3346190 RepID=UPI0036902DD5
MSPYALAYAPDAALVREVLPEGLRARFDTEMRKLAAAPYAEGSTPIREERDRRDATVAGCFVVYYVAQPVLRITAVRIQTPF